jgi:hypothetical protein
MSAGNTSSIIPATPSAAGMRGVFYLDSLGKVIRPVSPSLQEIKKRYVS